jgi:hypothetical protein
VRIDRKVADGPQPLRVRRIERRVNPVCTCKPVEPPRRLEAMPPADCMCTCSKNQP